jgi:hypothetical protein
MPQVCAGDGKDLGMIDPDMADKLYLESNDSAKSLL